MVNPLKTAPVHRFGPIPWGLHAEAYAGYMRKWGPSQSVERIAERGGFDIDEMDEFVPGWRDRLVGGSPGWGKHANSALVRITRAKELVFIAQDESTLIPDPELRKTAGEILGKVRSLLEEMDREFELARDRLCGEGS